MTDAQPYPIANEVMIALAENPDLVSGFQTMTYWILAILALLILAPVLEALNVLGHFLWIEMKERRRRKLDGSSET